MQFEQEQEPIADNSTEQATNSKEKTSKWKIICAAFVSFFWIYLPIFIMGITLALLGKFYKIIELPDMILVGALLFGESITHLKSSAALSKNELAAALFIGITGFVTSIILLIFNLIADYGDITGCDKPACNLNVDQDVYFVVLLSVWLLSVVYAVVIRVMTYSEKS